MHPATGFGDADKSNNTAANGTGQKTNRTNLEGE